MVFRCQTLEGTGGIFFYVSLDLSCSVLRVQVLKFLFRMFCLLGFAFSLLFEGSILVEMMEGLRGQESFSLASADAFVLLSVHTNPMHRYTRATHCHRYRWNRTLLLR